MQSVRVFISYAWEDSEYRLWVQRLATTLRQDGVDVRLDAWHRQMGQDLPSFMNAEVRNADRVLVLGSPKYRTKVHDFEENLATSGVGWEAMLLTAQIFSGNRDKVVVAVTRGSIKNALPDFLQTQLAYDLSAPEDPHGYHELLKALRGERSMAPPLGQPRYFESDEKTPLYEAPSGMGLTLELRIWIEARWPEGKPNDIYPAWCEFEAGKVTFPNEVIASVKASFGCSPRALVVGNSASGKSVLGAVIAYEWSRVTGRRAFWIDLGDHVGSSPDELRKDIKTFLSLSGANLLVLDNAQVAPAVADWAVNQIEVADRVGANDSRLLILTRPQARPDHQANLQDRLASERTVLIPNAAMFAAVAARLLDRHEHTPNWTGEDYELWVHEFGGDLICFGQAVLAAASMGKKPTRAMAAKRVRDAYIDPARHHDRGISILDRLAAAATLEMTIDDSALEGKVQQALPRLIECGQVQALERGRYRHWKLGHPGLGSLILEMRALDAGYGEANLRRAALLDIVRSNSFLLGAVVFRLAESTSGSAVELEHWSRTLQTEPAIIEDFLCRAISQAVEVDRLIPKLIPWKLLRDHSPRDRILGSCRHTPPQYVAIFLRYAERQEPDAVQLLLRTLLQDGEFRALLVRTPPHLVATFLLYAERQEPDAVQLLLRTLLQDGEFRALLVRTPPGDVVTFLRYAERQEPDAVQLLLRTLLQDGEFRALLVHRPPGDVATFLRYAERQEPDAVQLLLRTLLQDGEFRALLVHRPPGSVARFLRYAEHYEPGAVRALLRTVLATPEFVTRHAGQFRGATCELCVLRRETSKEGSDSLALHPSFPP